jgi:hypothetical protein
MKGFLVLASIVEKPKGPKKTYGGCVILRVKKPPPKKASQESSWPEYVYVGNQSINFHKACILAVRILPFSK